MLVGRAGAASTRGCSSRSRPTRTSRAARRASSGVAFPERRPRSVRRVAQHARPRARRSAASCPLTAAGVAGAGARDDARMARRALPARRRARARARPARRSSSPASCCAAGAVAAGRRRLPDGAADAPVGGGRRRGSALHLVARRARAAPAAGLRRRRRHLRARGEVGGAVVARSARRGRSSSPTRPTTSATTSRGATGSTRAFARRRPLAAAVGHAVPLATRRRSRASRYDRRRRRPDVSYSYADAVRDGICRPVTFVPYDGALQWRAGDDVVEASFDDALTGRDAARRYRTAISIELADGLPRILAAAHERLLALRAGGHRDAGGLVDRRRLRARARGREGAARDRGRRRRPSSCTPRRARARRSSRRSRLAATPWIVAVNMVSEGVDIPRLRVGVYATAAKTPLIFRQIVGRFVRTIPGRPRRAAAGSTCPADPVLRRPRAPTSRRELRHVLRPPGARTRRLLDEPAERRETEPSEALGLRPRRRRRRAADGALRRRPGRRPAVAPGAVSAPGAADAARTATTRRCRPSSAARAARQAPPARRRPAAAATGAATPRSTRGSTARSASRRSTTRRSSSSSARSTCCSPSSRRGAPAPGGAPLGASRRRPPARSRPGSEGYAAAGRPSTGSPSRWRRAPGPNTASTSRSSRSAPQRSHRRRSVTLAAAAAVADEPGGPSLA